MKKIGLIIIGLVLCFVVVAIATMQIKGWLYIHNDNPEPTNKNITFIGNKKGFYIAGKSIQLFDGSILTASTVNNIFTGKDYISLIKLTSKGKFEWEKKIQYAGNNIWTMMQNPFKSKIYPPHLEIMGLTLLKDRYYLLLNKTNTLENKLYILTLNSEYKLVKTQRVKLELENCTNFISCMQSAFAHITYLDMKNKMLCQTSINILEGKITHNAMLFFNQKYLHINAIAADKADTSASITAYDKKMGCSFYMYSKSTDIKEYFRTQPTSNFTMLKYIGDKLYGIVKEDSLLEIVDMTSLTKPLIIVNDKPDYADFRAVDMQIINGAIYVLLDIKKHDGAKDDWDVAIRKYSAPGTQPLEYLIHGMKLESASEIFATADKHFVVLGQSFSLRKGKMLKLFATKFPL